MLDPAGSPSTTFLDDSPTDTFQHDVDCLRYLCPTHASERIAEAVRRGGHGDKEPLERLADAASLVGLQCSPGYAPLADAIWRGRDDEPLVIWLGATQRWLILLRHGFFHVRVLDPATPGEVEKLSRRELTKRLGLADLSSLLEFAVVSPALPADDLRGTSRDETESLLPAYHVHAAAGAASAHTPVSPIRRLFGLLRPEGRDITALVIFSLVTGLLYLALPLAVNALVSHFAFGSRAAPFVQALIFIALALFACLLLSAIIRGLQYHIAEVIQRRLFVRVAADLAYRLPRVRTESLDGVHAPEMVNRFLDVVTVQKSAALLLLNGINIVLGSVVGLTVLGFYHPFLLAFTVFILIGIGIIVFGLGRGAIRTSIAESIGKYEIVNWLEEVARYPRLFKGPGGYALARERTDQLARHYLHARRSHFHILLRQICGLLFLEVLASSVLLIVGGWLVLSQQLTLGQLVASELIVSAIVASISKLGKQFEAWYDALSAVDKLGHVVDLETESDEGDTPAPTRAGASIKASDLSFSYPGGKPLLSGLTFEVPSGGRVAITGTQGSGCSTLMDLLLGLWQPTSGYLAVDGLDLRSWRLENLRQNVMLLRPQDIVSGTVADNLRLGLPGIGLEEVQRALEKVGLLQDIMELPRGMHTPLVTGGLPLSSRQRTRLLLARALVLKPRLLLLDDVFDGIDSDSVDELAAVVLDHEHAWTVVIATRDPRIAAKCDCRIRLGTPA